MTSWGEPSTLQIVSAALWVRSGCTSDVARVLVGAGTLQWDSWLERGRGELERGELGPCALLVDRLELADALRRAEVQRALHGYAIRNPDRLLEYIARRWPDAFADHAIAALGQAPTGTSGAARTLADHVLDAFASEHADDEGESDPREPHAGGSSDGGLVGDEPLEPGSS